MFKIIYLSIYFSHIGLEVRLDYDSINTILLLFSKKNSPLFSPLELYSLFGFFKRKNGYNLLFFPFFFILNCSFDEFY